MPLAPLTPEEIAAALPLASGDLRFIFEECHVREIIQAHIFRNGTLTLRRIAGFDDNKAGVQVWMQQIARPRETTLQMFWAHGRPHAIRMKKKVR